MIISPDCELLEYEGRIDFADREAPLFVYPCSYVRIRFFGRYLAVKLRNHHLYWDNYIGIILDGKQEKRLLSNSGEEEFLYLLEEEQSKEHDCIIFKRQDACHHVSFLGFALNEGAQVLHCQEKKQRRIEVYGDSVSAGEVSEAVDYTGKPDPIDHNGYYSNSWYSYAWILARKLNASIHDIAQGGVALMNKTGWFHEPDYIGMENIYDKIGYQSEIGEVRKWDFAQYTPHVVIVAIGQNDSHPVDFMKQDMDGKMATRWKTHYQRFLKELRKRYPDAEIILTTTILEHDSAWDMAIGECCVAMKDPKIHRFLYKKNGRGTPGHIRIPEAEEMAEEMYQYLLTLGEEIWLDK